MGFPITTNYLWILRNAIVMIRLLQDMMNGRELSQIKFRNCWYYSLLVLYLIHNFVISVILFSLVSYISSI